MHRVAIWIPLVAAIVLVAPAASGQEPGDQPAAPAVNAQVYVKFLVKHCSNDDPRLRFSVREGLRALGQQSVNALNEAKRNEKNKHVRAFIDRTLASIKEVVRPQTGQGGRRDWMSFMTRRFTSVDIDRIAMDVNLTWEQIEKVEPILKKAGKDAAELWKVFSEAGSVRDPEAWRDFREELKTYGDSVKSKLREHLKPQQVARLERYLNPFGGMNRMRGRGGRGGGGGGFGRERP